MRILHGTLPAPTPCLLFIFAFLAKNYRERTPRAVRLALSSHAARRDCLEGQVLGTRIFRVANGKLKLREENGSAALIFYRRDQSGPLMLSNYENRAGCRTLAYAQNARGCAWHDCRRRKNADPDDA